MKAARTAYAIMLVVRSWFALAWPVTLFSIASAPVLTAQQANPAQSFEGREVVAVQFDPPQQPLQPSELDALVSVKPGQRLERTAIRASIERLFASGRYSDIQVDAEPSGGGVILRFLTTNRWFIGNVAVHGQISGPPSATQLENAAQLDLGQPYADAKLQQAVAAQRRLLESNGLYRPRIQPLLGYDSTHQQVEIHFDIESGPRARFTTPVVRGDPKLDPAKILDATGWRRWLLHSWKPVTQARVRSGLDGLRKLYEKENRLQARVSLESMSYEPEMQTALPTLNIDAGPRIEVRTIGAKVSQKRLERFVPVFQEHAVDQDLLTEGARNLRDYLQSEGYFEAQVEFKQQRVTNDRASIDYLVNTGERQRLVHIGITGNRYFNADAIRERMSLQTASFLLFPHGRYSESQLSRDEDSIRALYESNGFREVKVTHRMEENYRGKKGDLAVFLEINEGAQFLIHSLSVEGIVRLERGPILAQLSSGEGQPFSDFNVAVDRDTILAEYFRRGFPNAAFEWSSVPSSDPHRIDLRYVINEGNEEFVREVLLSGLEVTRPSLVYNTLKMKGGDPLSPIAVTDAQRRLYDLGIFERVDTAIQNPDGETPDKYVLYETEEARRYSLAVGVGAEIARIGGCQTCLDAPAGATGFAPRVSLGITRNNMWGVAHSLSLRTRLSTLESQALLTYQWPRFAANDKLSVSFTGLYENSRDVRTFTYQRDEGSAQLSERLSKAITLLYRFTYRRVSVDEGTLKISPLLIPLLSQPVRLGLASTNLIQDRRDDPLDPRHGLYNTLDLGLAEHIFGSQRNFLRFLARNSTYHPIGKRFVLARSTEFGDIYAFKYAGNTLDAIPLPERFFAGGSTSDRGFPDFQAGPRDPATGFPLGGTALFFNQTELRFPLIGDNIGGVLFHDAGNVFSSLSNFSFRTTQHDKQDFDYMVHAAGFGIRYRTPIGPVRLDLAYSINPPRFFGFQGSEQDLVNAGVTPCAPQPGGQSRCVDQAVSHFQFFFSIGQTF
ncbi:MAG: BamA/TamA family outer membrane protein [Acidobacteriia bacterium]|nr:BamA/TamA family outer membrane protein [Terriglobia bacterium]